ncbi:MAG: hypothetical protein PHO48_01380 [Candidatus Gracilibacteria bacterium]|nr:hypothetical protein [Candidatus Gracilibacteria bacterium]MDD5178771.1 hypothetical protein [Candidatus Gracilibacteria bacterium]
MLKPTPQFFDIFGFLGFIYIVAIAGLLLSGIVLPQWAIIILLLIGIIGLVIDGIIVYKFYLKK